MVCRWEGRQHRGIAPHSDSIDYDEDIGERRYSLVQFLL